MQRFIPLPFARRDDNAGQPGQTVNGAGKKAEKPLGKVFANRYALVRGADSQAAASTISSAVA
ncbi:MAG: hypothetical protein WBA36_07700 [Mesorhizobium sp.]